MVSYNVNNLKVLKVKTRTNIHYLICKFNKMTHTYTEVLTNKKVEKSDVIEEKPLADYCSDIMDQSFTPRNPLMLDKKALLSKYEEINSGLALEKSEKISKEKNKRFINFDSILKKATADFFPKTGVWYIHCFTKTEELDMLNLPCHLRDDNWLAQLLKQEKKLYLISYKKILNFVKTSPYFEEKRHQYEQTIVKWQIQWIMEQRESWICGEKYNGFLTYYSPLVDLLVRNCVVYTLLKIGINKEAIEEGLEKNANLWREQCLRMAFKNEYDSFYSDEKTNSDKNKIDNLQPPDPNHMANWIKMRKYEYYHQHKESVDKYGVVEPEMLMSQEEVSILKLYLDEKNAERKEYIEKYHSTKNGRRLKK